MPPAWQLVTVTATRRAGLAGGSAISASTAGPSQAGQVTVNGARLKLTDAGSVNSSTAGDGAAGDVTVAMSETVALVGGGITTDIKPWKRRATWW